MKLSKLASQMGIAMNAAQTLIDYRKLLHKSIAEPSDTLRILERLNNLSPPTAQDLKLSELGIYLNKLRKSGKTNEVQNLATVIVQKWMRAVEQVMSSIPWTTKAATTGHPVRDENQRILLTAISGSDELAVRTESAIFMRYRKVSEPYQTDITALLKQLTDETDELKDQLLTGKIQPESLVDQKSDLANDRMKKWRQNQSRSLIEQTRAASKNQSNVSDQFQCGRCNQRKVTYFQIQTRGADEPITTFITCTVCDNKWKS